MLLPEPFIMNRCVSPSYATEPAFFTRPTSPCDSNGPTCCCENAVFISCEKMMAANPIVADFIVAARLDSGSEETANRCGCTQIRIRIHPRLSAFIRGNKDFDDLISVSARMFAVPGPGGFDDRPQVFVFRFPTEHAFRGAGVGHESR